MRFSQIREAIFLALIFLCTHAQLYNDQMKSLFWLIYIEVFKGFINTCSRVELRKVGYTQVSTIIFSSKGDWSVGAY